jgi:flagellum-specific peptidoglycan hydrolase FlgJ
VVIAGVAVFAAAGTGAAAKPSAVPAVIHVVTGTHPKPAPATAPAQLAGTAAQRAFINDIAPGAVEGQRTYGVPAAVTIAQAIDESAWGAAAPGHNLFGIKCSGGPCQSLPTEEFEDGRYVHVMASFAIFPSWSDAITAHDRMIATLPIYSRAMADRGDPYRFAGDLTGVYATDPSYGATLGSYISTYALTRYDQ